METIDQNNIPRTKFWVDMMRISYALALTTIETFTYNTFDWSSHISYRMGIPLSMYTTRLLQLRTNTANEVSIACPYGQARSFTRNFGRMLYNITTNTVENKEIPQKIIDSIVLSPNYGNQINPIKINHENVVNITGYNIPYITRS